MRTGKANLNQEAAANVLNSLARAIAVLRELLIYWQTSPVVPQYGGLLIAAFLELGLS